MFVTLSTPYTVCSFDGHLDLNFDAPKVTFAEISREHAKMSSYTQFIFCKFHLVNFTYAYVCYSAPSGNTENATCTMRIRVAL